MVKGGVEWYTLVAARLIWFLYENKQYYSSHIILYCDFYLSLNKTPIRLQYYIWTLYKKKTMFYIRL